MYNYIMSARTDRAILSTYEVLGARPEGRRGKPGRTTWIMKRHRRWPSERRPDDKGSLQNPSVAGLFSFSFSEVFDVERLSKRTSRAKFGLTLTGGAMDVDIAATRSTNKGRIDYQQVQEIQVV